MLSTLDVTLQKELQNFIAINVFWTKNKNTTTKQTRGPKGP